MMRLPFHRRLVSILFLFLQARLISVGNDGLTTEDLAFLLVKEMGLPSFQKVLDLSVTQLLVAQYAKRQGISVSQEQISEFLQQMLGERLTDFYALFGENTMKKWAEIQLLFDEMVRKKEQEFVQLHHITVKDSEISDYYQRNVHKWVKPETVRFQFIFSSKESTISAIEKALQEGEDFAQVARKYSESDEWDVSRPLSYEEIKNVFPKGIADEVFKAPLKQPQKVQTRMGTFWIYVLEKNPLFQPKLEEMKEDIQKILIQERVDPYMQEWFSQVTREIPVQFDLKLMQELLMGKAAEEPAP
ncbi:MAG: peptidyl-prolyl cis-trans isomerase [bacterium JZ-2024 1]